MSNIPIPSACTNAVEMLNMLQEENIPYDRRDLLIQAIGDEILLKIPPENTESWKISDSISITREGLITWLLTEETIQDALRERFSRMRDHFKEAVRRIVNLIQGSEIPEELSFFSDLFHRMLKAILSKEEARKLIFDMFRAAPRLKTSLDEIKKSLETIKFPEDTGIFDALSLRKS